MIKGLGQGSITLYFLTEGLSYALLWIMGMGLGQESIIERYFYMHSGKSSLVLMLRLLYA